MNTKTIEQALRRLGETVVYHADIELLLVGGAAAMLTNLVPPSRTTRDCDVMVYAPAEAMVVVESAADRVAVEMGLGPGWLNSDVQMRIDTLPEGWKRRRVFVAAHGRLRLWAASRPDLIAMKVIAGRTQDLEDLAAMKPRRDDVAFVRAHLATLSERGTPQQQIDDALALLGTLETHEHE